MQTSLIPVSIGTAAENKPLTSTQLNVVAHELLPALDGYLSVNPETVTGEGKRPDGSDYQTSVQSDVVITATWLPYGSNRVTPPDIRRGERVMLYRVADTDQYYWRDLGLDASFRRLESVIFAWNANPSIADSGFDPDNAYYFEVSTHNKSITMGTSKANGEPFAYTLQFDTAEGSVTLSDDIGTFVQLNSAEKQIVLMNAAQSYFNMHDKNLSISVLGDIDIKAGKSIKMESGTSTEHKAGTTFTTEAGTDLTETAGGTHTTTATGPMTVNANTTFTQSTKAVHSLTVGATYTTTVQGIASLTCTGPYTVTTPAYTLMSPVFLQEGGATLTTDGIIKSTNPGQPCIRNN